MGVFADRVQNTNYLKFPPIFNDIYTERAMSPHLEERRGIIRIMSMVNYPFPVGGNTLQSYVPRTLRRKAQGLVRFLSTPLKALYYGIGTAGLLLANNYLSFANFKTALVITASTAAVWLLRKIEYRLRIGSIRNSLNEEISTLRSGQLSDDVVRGRREATVGIISGISRNSTAIWGSNKPFIKATAGILDGVQYLNTLYTGIESEFTPSAVTIQPAAEKFSGGELFAQLKNSSTRLLGIMAIINGRAMGDREVLKFVAQGLRAARRKMSEGIPVSPSSFLPELGLIVQAIRRIEQNNDEKIDDIEDLIAQIRALNSESLLKQLEERIRHIASLGECGKEIEVDSGNLGNIKKLLEDIIKKSINPFERELAESALYVLRKQEEDKRQPKGGAAAGGAVAGGASDGPAPARGGGGK